MTEKAEKLNGKDAMLGMFALLGAYYFTGKFFQDFLIKILVKFFQGFIKPFFIGLLFSF
ncbi:hypothetical protein [Prochlorococcus sp. MIT 1314]|uniref:hypothetical protein n=1 Tax=Prochlorococcus sp. MIT 1314 TaxID=3096220 RepID=UPI0039C1D068